VSAAESREAFAPSLANGGGYAGDIFGQPLRELP